MYVNLDDMIYEYIDIYKNRLNIVGSLLCGSYVSGGYNAKSDIDLLVLSSNHPFEMILEEYRNILFDRMIVDPELLKAILFSECELSNILSLSFGLCQKVIIKSKDIDEIVIISENNIKERELKYIKDKEKPLKIIDEIPYLVKKINEKYYLIKNKVIII